MLMNMEFTNRRKFHRINFDGKVHLQFSRHSYGSLQVKDLSLTGMFVMGHFPKRQMESCLIKIFHKEKSDNNCVQALGEIVWGNDEGVGLRFTEMTLGDYILLQTTLIKKAEQPEIVLREFPTDCPYEISSMESV